MSWRSAADKYRAPLSIDNTGGGAGAIDATVSIPVQWDHFWNNVQSTGNDVRVTDPDGVTVLTFDLDSFTVATRTGTIEVDNYTAPAAGMLLFWLYWGDSSLSSGETPFVPAGAKTGYADLGSPANPLVIVTDQQRLADTTPRAMVAKTTDSSIYIWWDFSALLQQRLHPYNNSHELECIKYVSGYTVVKAGVDQAAMKDVTKTRFEVGTDGVIYVKTYVTAGTTANDYLITLTVVTTEGRTLTGQCKLLVRDMSN